MEVFSLALQKRAVKIILVHNHPSGELLPSESDKDITDRLIQVGIIVNTPVIDHLIISETGFYSFTFMGLLKQLQESTKWIPKYKEIELIKKQAEKVGRKAGILENKKEVARKALAKGLPVDVITELTGLSIKEINNLKED